MVENPLLGAWAEGNPTLVVSVDVARQMEHPRRPDGVIGDAPWTGLPWLRWLDSARLGTGAAALPAELSGCVVEVRAPEAGVDPVALVDDLVRHLRYGPDGTRPWVPPATPPTDPARHRAAMNQQFLTAFALVGPWDPATIELLADHEALDGLVAVGGASPATPAEVADVIVDVCDERGLTPVHALTSTGVEVLDRRAVEGAEALGFGATFLL